VRSAPQAEAAHQAEQLGGQPRELLGRAVRLAGALRRAAGGLGDAGDVARDLAGTGGASVTLRPISSVVTACSSTAAAMTVWMSLMRG
jgi:hypothetical protein